MIIDLNALLQINGFQEHSSLQHNYVLPPFKDILVQSLICMRVCMFEKKWKQQFCGLFSSKTGLKSANIGPVKV